MKTTAEMIAVMQAFERGEVIEFKHRLAMVDWWTLKHQPVWNWSDTDYRIKPREPRVIWVNEYWDTAYIHDSEDEAKKHATGEAKRTAVKYIEVIE